MISQIPPNTIQQIDPISSALSSLSASLLSSLVASLDEMIRKDLEAFRAVFFWCLVAATVAVVVGVILEEAQEWMPTVKKVLRLDPIVEYRWAKKLVKLGWILIVVGVAGEGIFEVYVSRADSILNAFDNILLTEARKQASDAVLGAATANRRVAEARHRTAELEKEAAQLRKDAAQLQRDAEAEHLARVKIEGRVTWRKLDPKTQSAIASQLTQFAKEPALVSYNPADIEAADFASHIATVLHAANWDVFEPLAFSKGRGGPVPFGTNSQAPRGVLVWATNDKVSVQAANALVKELSAYGFDALMSAEANILLGIHPTATRVVVSVEYKPDGPQGEYKLQAERDAKAKKQQVQTNHIAN